MDFGCFMLFRNAKTKVFRLRCVDEKIHSLAFAPEYNLTFRYFQSMHIYLSYSKFPKLRLLPMLLMS